MTLVGSGSRGVSAPFDPLYLRRCFGKFATGVTVVSLAVDGRPHGLTVNSFASVSLDPPLVLICVDKRSKAAAGLSGTCFAVNVLSAAQENLAWHFAGKSRLGEIAWEAAGDVPCLPHSLARILCRPWSRVDAGDHFVVVGEVYEFTSGETEPLAFFAGRFARLQTGAPSGERSPSGN
ncbi:flavin reductase family protein [Nitratireductor sp. ZSWI3]|uniref:flavin reductase family protein n=1 Tax=Nitratireductor sp. ZSWI3 TaxID=2966359 RepID=UPI0021505547|nr:flavin reductase family protein [Nitratireductor sp. ZSWI3]MCR4266642.1 flavin reductase family protein [Nitratireductor sp. ZSWI3]